MTESAQEFYGRWADLYDLLARRTPGIRQLRRKTVNALRLDRGDTVVEMGCGSGANLPLLRDAVGREGTVIGLDYTRPILDRADRSLARAGRGWGPDYDDVHLVHGDATRPPIDGPVDAVLATFVVGMLDDPPAAVDGWWDLLAPGGHLVLCNAHSAESGAGRRLNPLFRVGVVLSTPPTGRLRYEEDLVAMLDDRVGAAHHRLRDRSTAVADERDVGGFVTITGGRRGTKRERSDNQ